MADPIPTTTSTLPEPELPRTFFQYLRSMGPGLVVVLTWLGAGDIVDMGVAGANYGYSLMWVLVLSVIMRFVFVSVIAKYQLCNQHQESVLDGLTRLHPIYAPFLLLAAIVMGHVYASYMTVGIGETCSNLFGIGEVWQWALFWNLLGLALVLGSGYLRMELLFKIFLAVLVVSFLGTAVAIGPNPAGIAQGLYRVGLPEQVGKFNPLLVAMAMIGAVGGSLGNLLYPYFLEKKGWRGPKYRRLQTYDLMLAVLAMIVLNLSVWVLGAELLHPEGLNIEKLDDLPKLLSGTLGATGRSLFYAGIFAAIFTSLIGHAMGLALMGSHAWLRWHAGTGKIEQAYEDHSLYRWIVIWCLISPLVWTLPGMPDFVTLTLVANSLQVVLIPLIAGGLWCITSSDRCIGRSYRNGWWENLVVGGLFGLGLVGAWKAVESIAKALMS